MKIVVIYLIWVKNKLICSAKIRLGFLSPRTMLEAAFVECDISGLPSREIQFRTNVWITKNCQTVETEKVKLQIKNNFPLLWLTGSQELVSDSQYCGGSIGGSVILALHWVHYTEILHCIHHTVYIPLYTLYWLYYTALYALHCIHHTA